MLKEIPIGDIEPDETISAVNEARLLSKVGTGPSILTNAIATDK